MIFFQMFALRAARRHDDTRAGLIDLGDALDRG